jgi:dipeptidyl aminopeptidase/acylaminoacyl peptidase
VAHTDINEHQPGFWPSHLDEKAAIGATVEYSQLQCSPTGDVVWVEQRPLDKSRCVLCCLDQSQVKDITPEGYSVRSKVHEYGGLSWCFVGSSIAFVNEADQQLYIQESSNQECPSSSLHSNLVPKRLTEALTSRFIEPVWDVSLNRLLAIEELHGDDEIINRLVAISLLDGQVSVLHSAYDFYSYPVCSSTSDEVAFIGWNHPYQPWVSTELVLIGKSGGEGKVIAGQDQQESLSQPLFTGDGCLLVISDRGGWWNIYQYESAADDLRIRIAANNDMMSAPWQSGLRHYVYDDVISHIEIRHEGSQLYSGEQSFEIDDVANVRYLTSFKGELFALASFPDRLDAVIKIERSGEMSVVAGGAYPLVDADCSRPVPLVFGEAKARSYGYLYSPANAEAEQGDPKASPLVVFLHGGPTAATYPVLNLKIQYWTQRGFSVLDLNYRGSSNYGRDYRLSLKQAWGTVEVEDIDNAVRYLVGHEYCHPEGIFIRGNSSGGYSALNALCHLTCFSGGASLYGVTDPLVLNECTHKFESHYLEWLIGDPALDADRYHRLAPIDNADKINTPVIFFQGENDKVVLPEQTKAMVEILNQRRIPVEAIYFPDEAHGFRQLENNVRVLHSELSFYQALLPTSL